MKSLLRALPLLSIALASGLAHAQGFPSKPVHINAAGAGSGGDFLARLLAGEMAGPLGQPVVVENRTGGVILFMAVAKAPPDGYNLIVSGNALWIGPLLDETTPYEAFRDFAPITMMTAAPNLLIVHSSLPGSVAELIKVAKARPGALNYASGALGTASHIAGELFKSLTGTDIVRIAYKDQAQQTVDTVAGTVHLTFGQGTTWVPLIKAGKLRALASTGAKRSALYPDLPALAETVPGYLSEQVFGLFATGKSPDAAVRRINQEAVRALNKPESRAQMLANGQETVAGSPEQLVDYMKADVSRVEKIIKSSGGKFGAS